MLDQLMQMISQSGQQSVVQNNEVPNELNDSILNEAQLSIANGLKGLADTGGLQNLAAEVQTGNIQQNAAVNRISGDFQSSIMEKFGLNSGIAKTIAASIIPIVLGKVMQGSGAQQSGGGSGFDLGGLLSSLTGGSNPGANAGGGLMGSISNIGSKLGLDKDGDGDVDLNDLSKLIK